MPALRNNMTIQYKPVLNILTGGQINFIPDYLYSFYENYGLSGASKINQFATGIKQYSNLLIELDSIYRLIFNTTNIYYTLENIEKNYPDIKNLIYLPDNSSTQTRNSEHSRADCHQLPMPA